MRASWDALRPRPDHVMASCVPLRIHVLRRIARSVCVARRGRPVRLLRDVITSCACVAVCSVAGRSPTATFSRNGPRNPERCCLRAAPLRSSPSPRNGTREHRGTRRGGVTGRPSSAGGPRNVVVRHASNTYMFCAASLRWAPRLSGMRRRPEAALSSLFCGRLYAAWRERRRKPRATKLHHLPTPSLSSLFSGRHPPHSDSRHARCRGVAERGVDLVARTCGCWCLHVLY